MNTSFLQENMDSVLPSFFYGEEEADLSAWTKETVSDTTSVRHSPDGLLDLRITRKNHPGFPVLEYLPELIAAGGKKTKQIRAFQSFRARLDMTRAECVIRTVHGSECNPFDFTARRTVMADREGDCELVFGSFSGRSSSAYLPWIGIDLDHLHGFELAVGWSGSWKASCRVSGSALDVSFGMAETDFHLNPGEQVRQPSVMVFFRDGEPVSPFLGRRIRRFMIERKAPRDGKNEVFGPRLCCAVGGGNRSPELGIRTVDYMADNALPFDTVWMDAGWYGPEHHPDPDTNCGDCWYKYVGDWRINTGVHPTGSLRTVSDHAHEKGYDFLLWFEPERAAAGAPVVREHPEYFLSPEKGVLHPTVNCLDLGNPDAWNWIFRTVSGIIRENGVDVYRQDFNFDPAPFWAAHDEPDRKGMHEIRHIEGLYRYLDALKAEFPDMLMENCASGGRRLDFEMASRAHSYCRSDFPIPRTAPGELKHRHQILMGQNAVMNLSPYLPFHGAEFNCVAPFCDYDALSAGLPTAVFTPSDWESGLWKRDFMPEETAWFKKIFGVLDRARKILRHDWIPLTPPSDLDESVWVAWQGDAPHGGCACFFRRKDAPDAERTFALSGIDPEAWYILEDQNGNRKETAGSELKEITIRLPEPESVCFFFYERGNFERKK